MQTDNFGGSENIKLPAGFQAAGIHAGLKADGQLDMALLFSETPAAMAGVFTANRCAAAPVRLCQRHLRHQSGQAIVVNSGIANACTGAQGDADAYTSAEELAALMELETEEVFVCSTGSIGTPLPMDKISKGIAELARQASTDGGDSAAQAIMTTDTHTKKWSVEIVVDDNPVTVAGIAKGAGMIQPDMATMLAFVMTDATVERHAMQDCLAAAVEATFNRITVDGDMSTNDTVLMMANGMAGTRALTQGHPDWASFCMAVEEVASRLAWMILEDGEGATKLATVNVRGAASDECAEKAARAVANSFLVKTAWAGDKPAYGRVVDALGYSGAQLEADKIDVAYNGLKAITSGSRGDATEEQLRQCVREPHFTVYIHLHQGERSATVYTCNITEEYVRINME